MQICVNITQEKKNLCEKAKKTKNNLYKITQEKKNLCEKAKKKTTKNNESKSYMCCDKSTN